MHKTNPLLHSDSDGRRPTSASIMATLGLPDFENALGVREAPTRPPRGSREFARGPDYRARPCRCAPR